MTEKKIIIREEVTALATVLMWTVAIVAAITVISVLDYFILKMFWREIVLWLGYIPCLCGPIAYTRDPKCNLCYFSRDKKKESLGRVIWIIFSILAALGITMIFWSGARTIIVVLGAIGYSKLF